MKVNKKAVSFILAGIMAVMSCGSMPSSAYTRDDMDVNGDKVVSIADVVLIMQYLKGTHEPADLSRYDVNGNGIVGEIDAYIIQLYDIGLVEAE